MVKKELFSPSLLLSSTSILWHLVVKHAKLSLLIAGRARSWFPIVFAGYEAASFSTSLKLPRQTSSVTWWQPLLDHISFYFLLSVPMNALCWVLLGACHCKPRPFCSVMLKKKKKERDSITPDSLGHCYDMASIGGPFFVSTLVWNKISNPVLHILSRLKKKNSLSRHTVYQSDGSF
jgi:hypothetical protein